MSIHRFKYLFQQFINKTGTPEETEEFLELMKGENYDDELRKLLDEFWSRPESFDPMESGKAERLFNKIISSQSQQRGKVTVFNRSWIGVAAAVVLIAGIATFLYRTASNGSDATVVQSNHAETPKPQVSSRRFINLPDGSSVILNENSTLDYASFDKNGKREVILTGEAYFDIVHDKSHPFIVYTGKLRTTVLGTAFNIKANPGTETVVVTVTRGKVKVGDSKRTYNVIDPDEQVIFNTQLSTYVKKPVKVQLVTAWTGADMYFDDVSMKDVANQLQERFNVSIVFSNERIKNCRFSATFLQTQTLEQILNIIGEFNHIKYQFQNKHTIVLGGAGCS